MKCRARSKVFKDQPTSGQRKALEQQCVKEFDILTENFEHDANVKLLYLFHTKHGYGKKRLKRLSKDINDVFQGLHARYELDETDSVWLCKKKLEDDGIDVDELLKESED